MNTRILYLLLLLCPIWLLGQKVTDISLDTEKPWVTREFNITLNGYFPNGCFTGAVINNYKTTDGQYLDIDVSYNRSNSEFCTQAIVPFSVSKAIRIYDSGSFEVRINGKTLETPAYVEVHEETIIVNGICSKATPITCGKSISGSTSNESNLQSTYNCLRGYTWVGPEKVYSFSLETTSTVTINLGITTSRLDLDLFLLGECYEGVNCVAQSSADNATTTQEKITKTLSPGTYYIVIDGQYATSKGSFTLSLTCSGSGGGGGETGGSICSKAAPISCGNTVSGSTTNETNELTTYNCLQGYTLVGPEKVYKLTISQRTPVTINLTIATTGLDLDLFLLGDVCRSGGTNTKVYSISSGDCIAESSTPNTSSRTESITKTLDPGTYYIVIDGQYSYSKGSFQLAVNCGGDPEGSICSKATPISCGSSVSGSTSSETNYLTTYNCLQGYTLVGPEKVYKLTLTERTPVTINLDIQTTGLDLDLFLLGDVCRSGGISTRVLSISSGDCIAESSTPNTSSRTETIVKTLEAGTYYIVIDGQYAYSKGSFQLSVSCGTNGNICDKAMPISCGSTVNGSTSNETNYLTTYSCLRGYSLVGPEKVYKLTLSEKTTVNIDLSILTQGLDLDLFLISDVCGRYVTYSKVESSDCLAESSTPNTSSNKETIVKTLEAGVYYIIVDGQYSYSKGSFQLKVDCSGGSICDKAMPISCGNEVSGSTLNETNFLTTYTCLRGYTLVGPEKVYKFTVTERTPVTINLAIQTSNLDLDLFLLSDVCSRFGPYYYKVEAPECLAESSTPNTSSNIETITKILDPGTYYIVIDGQYSYSKGNFRLSLNCCNQTPKQYNCGYITYKYTGSGGSLRYSFNSSQSIASGQSWMVNDRAISTATGNTFDYVFPSAGNYQICFPYRNTEGCIEYCCYDIYVGNPFDCYDFDYRYNSSSSAFQFTLNKPGANNVSWVVDDTGQSLGSGSTSNLLPLPGTCVERTITVRYYWNNRWYICCRKIWLCNPFDCYDFDYRFVSNVESNGYQFNLDKPGATNVSWVVDDTGSSLGTGATSNLLPIPGTCVRRTISVRYYWNGRWYICCRSIWLCNPLDCTPIVYRYVPNQGYQFSLTESETSSQTWTIDETGQAIGSGTQSQYVRPPSNCVNYTISVRYYKNGIWYFCCLRIRICDPLSCNTIRYVTQNNGYQLTLDDTNAQQITWLDDDDNSRVLVTNQQSTVIPLPTPCRDRLISVRYYDPISRTWRYCCVLIKCGTPLPTCTNDNCNLISYRYFESSGFQFTLNQAGASSVNWSVLETGQQVGTGISVGGIRPVTDCQVRTFMARYTLNGQEYVCCRKIWMCDPFNCNPIRYTYSDQGYQFALDETGTSEQTWVIDDTNEAIGTGPVSVFVRPPSGGNCITRTISVRYYKNGTWYFCCQRIVICDPFSCQNIRYTQSGTNYSLNLDDSNANQIVWLDDNNNGLVLSQNVKAVSIPVPSPCVDRIISVKYYDPISRTWRYCCVRIPCGQVNCQLSVNPSTLQFTQSGGEQSVTVTSNATWVVNTPSENWIQATLVSGTSTLRVQVSPNNSTQARTATLVLTCGGTSVRLAISQTASAGTGGGTPPWDEPVVSSVSHTVAILKDVQSKIGNATLEVGDYIGFFYKASNGNLVIAGKRKWEARNSLITVYGDDPSSPAQEGFKNDEVFNIKVWKASDNKEYDVVPEYLPLGTLIGNATIDAQEKFRNQAVSGISKLSAGSGGIVYDLLLKKGWNLISSKATPSKPDMEEVFNPIVTDIELVKSISLSYVPGFDNALGNWDIQQGYFVKAKKDITLSIAGTKINPAAVSLPLREGWQILPYFCDDNRPVGEIFSDPTLGVTLVKSLTSTYVPGFSDADAICMKPGQGYQVLIRNGTKRQLTLNCAGTTCTTPLRDIPTPELRGSELSHQFVTAHNASLLFYKHLLANLPLDSKIKVYDSQGILRGMETFIGKNLQVIIWGDDPYTSYKDGLIEKEKFQVLFVTKEGKEVSMKELGLELSSLEYHTNDLVWAKRLPQQVFFPKAKVSLYPNPTQYSTWLQLELDYSGEVLVNLMDIQGRKVQSTLKLAVIKGVHREQLNTSGLKPGIYLIQVTFRDQILTHRLVIQ